MGQELEPVPGSWAFLELEPVKEINKKGSKEPESILFRGSWSREPVKKNSGSPTLVLGNIINFYEFVILHSDL